MIFPEKLQLARNVRGITQDQLAAALNVSRQAVAKWESGHAYPDIDNLIALSEFFHVTVDHLVRDRGGCEAGLQSKSPETPEGLAEFLLRAKRATYAGKGAESEPSRPGSHDFQYEEGCLRYLDSYVGGECFSGEEAVWKCDRPVYAMNYCGRVLKADFSGDFLKAALLKAPLERPFRGPAAFQEGDSAYVCKVDGSIDWFQGQEEIYYQNTRIYECFFHGALLR